jgi:Uma2 family endonuclease
MLCIFIELGFRLSADTVRIPDIAFVSTERAKQIDPDRPIDGALTLVVEVVSPTELAAELARKWTSIWQRVPR